MSSIVVCGGGGKTTIARKYPSLFVDIDDFVWSPVNQDHHRQLEHACETKNVAVIQTIYRGIMEKHATHLANCGKIILIHHPENAVWLGTNNLGILKPSRSLHLSNIQNRPSYLREIAVQNWNELSSHYRCTMYASHDEFEQCILQLL